MRGGRGGGYASIVDAGSVLLALTSDSELVAFKPSNKEYAELARYKVADTPTWAMKFPYVNGGLFGIPRAAGNADVPVGTGNADVPVGSGTGNADGDVGVPRVFEKQGPPEPRPPRSPARRHM